MFQIDLKPTDTNQIFEKATAWAMENFPYVAVFHGNSLKYPQGTFPQAIYAGHQAKALNELEKKNASIVGIVSYDYKNQLEKLSSENSGIVAVPDTLFFEAAITLAFQENSLVIQGLQSEELYQHIQRFEIESSKNPSVTIQPLTSKEQYIAHVQAIQQHIEEGDMYELNYCLGYAFDAPQWSPIQAFRDLMHVSPMPFSVFFKAKDQYLIGASPERFLKRTGDTLIAQPIKGTICRGNTPEEDELLAATLLHSEKERAENLMIVDLMRNDLSKISEVGSVEVEELFGVYAFPRVHQMISTVKSQVKKGIDFSSILQATFPMGSMTGAPKIKCMELIDRYEDFRRGWFSGTVGLLQPSGDFDFNVIIRSIIYDQNTGKGYFAVGSAITYDADPAYEYEECQLKASAIRQVLEGTVSS
ncbi:anthranilate synthase component I family protein [Mongoliitalea lutea]|uniref:Para-aminobenzoate synthase n=1 Tax=Mongoliitalea lutea TaxID=849756 RepID=A0A8J3CUC1_9BACT|nr:anthranilate synthase component I family protein [Mongoliitalea lutea]GHB25087.1 para-aminobenzoate synthase [Mongoliitalea lutea]